MYSPAYKDEMELFPPAATAKAFAPGHVTGLFVPVTAPADPLSRGSLGAGLVLEVGATAKVTATPAPHPSLSLWQGDRPADLPVTRAAVEKLLAQAPKGWELRVELAHALPISSGMGMSAAGTLAASLATTRLLGLDARKAVEAAHRAELEAHTGLGGVAAILGGGLEVRRRAGLEPWGLVERTPVEAMVLLAFRPDPMPSPPLLSDPHFLDRVREAGEGLLSRLPPPPLSVETFQDSSNRFTESLGLASGPVLEALQEGRREGLPLAQAMLGQALFLAVPAGNSEGRTRLERAEKLLQDRGFGVQRVRVGSTGAHLQ